jgi:hypothetical protein
VFDGVEESDAAGPWEVLTCWTRNDPDDGWAESRLSKDGRPATTHWGALDELRVLDATVQLRPDDCWLDGGDLLTSAGVSAGVDMALHTVARLAGIDRAHQVGRGIQYGPQPPI